MVEKDDGTGGQNIPSRERLSRLWRRQNPQANTIRKPKAKAKEAPPEKQKEPAPMPPVIRRRG